MEIHDFDEFKENPNVKAIEIDGFCTAKEAGCPVQQKKAFLDLWHVECMPIMREEKA